MKDNIQEQIRSLEKSIEELSLQVETYQQIVTWLGGIKVALYQSEKEDK